MLIHDALCNTRGDLGIQLDLTYTGFFRRSSEFLQGSLRDKFFPQKAVRDKFFPQNTNKGS